MNGLRITSWKGGRKVAEGVGGVLPGFVLKGPPALATSRLEGFRLSVLGNFEHIGGFVLTYFAQFSGRLFWWEFADY